MARQIAATGADLWASRTAVYAELSAADGLAVLLPFRGGFVDFAAHGLAGPLGALPGLGEALGSAMGGGATSVVGGVGAALADGRRANLGLVVPIRWEGRSIGALVAVRHLWPFLAADATQLAAIARLVAVELFATHARLPAGGSAAVRPPRRSRIPSGMPAATPASVALPLTETAPPAVGTTPGRPWAPVTVATLVAQALAIDGAALVTDGAQATGALGTGALALAFALQVLALFALRRVRALRALLAALLLAFVGAGMSALLLLERPEALVLTLGVALWALLAALLAARALRASPAGRT